MTESEAQELIAEIDSELKKSILQLIDHDDDDVILSGIMSADELTQLRDNINKMLEYLNNET